MDKNCQVARRKSAYLPPSVVLVSVCHSRCKVSIQTTAPSLPTISSTAIATKRRSPSPAGGRVRRTIVPTLSRRTGLLSETLSATIATILLSNWIYSTVSMLSCTSMSTSSCRWKNSKIRVGSKVRRVYDDPQTPYARVLTSPDVSEAHKVQLRETYALLDLVDLRRQINELQVAILNTVSTQ
jgi:hypothetical protein